MAPEIANQIALLLEIVGEPRGISSELLNSCYS